MSNKVEEKDLTLVDEAISAAVEQRAEAKSTKDNVVKPQEYFDKLKADLTRDSRDSRALSELSELVDLIVITHQEKTILATGMMDIVNRFIQKATDDEGNGERFIKSFLVAGKNFDEIKDDFIPKALDTTKQKVHFIKFKQPDGTIFPSSFQRCWPFTYRQKDLIQYFIRGQLNEFISMQIQEHLNDSIIVFLYDFIMTKLTEENVNNQPAGKIVNGTAANLFEALTTELLPEINMMRLNSSEYNVDTKLVEAIDASKKEDLIMIAHPKVMTMLKTNIRAQLFNNAKLDLYDFVETMHLSNSKFDFTGETVKVKKGEFYVDENTIVVVDKKSFFKAIKMLEVSGEQGFITNITTTKIVHLWFASGYLPWGKRLIYKNNNLTVSPTAP